MSRLLCRKVFTLRLQLPLSRNMSAYLIEDPKYSFLKDLGLEKKNVGVFNGKWNANGQVCDTFLKYKGRQHLAKLC